MNEFVNYGKRGIDLPPGCKNLLDMLPPPRTVTIPAEGFMHIERYLSRMLQAAPKRASLHIWSVQNHRVHFSIQFKDGTLSLLVLIVTPDSIREQAVLSLFQEAGILPVRDLEWSPYGAPVRMLDYPLPLTVPAAADLIRAFLRRVFGLADDAGLEFHYRERDAR